MDNRVGRPARWPVAGRGRASNRLKHGIPGLALIALLSVTGPVQSQQIAPNPNLAGDTISVVTPGEFNADFFTNFGVIDISGPGRLLNTFVLENDLIHASIRNHLAGTLTNQRELTNRSGSTLTNSDPGTNLINFAGLLHNVGANLFNQSGAALTNQSGATLHNNGATLTNQTGATLTNESGALLINDGATLTNQTGATLTNSGAGTNLLNQSGATLTNQSGAVINNQEEALLENSANIVNDSQINNSATVVVTNTGSVSGVGTYTQTSAGFMAETAEATRVDGTWTQGLTDLQSGLLHGTGTVGGTVKNQAMIRGGGAGGITLTGDVSGAGNYEGTVIFTGSLSPGNSPALVTGNTMVFDASHVLKMELGGLARGSEYDAIDALLVDLGGTLNVSLLDLGLGLFNPQLGDFFDIMAAGNFLDDFSAFVLPMLSSGLMWTYGEIDLGVDGHVYRLSVVQQQGNMPVPGTALLMMLGVMMLLLRQHGGRLGVATARRMV